jgi:hypothetical protein
MRRLAVALFLVVSACSNGGSQGTATAPPPSVGEPAPSTGEEVDTVNRVLAGLDAVMGDLQRILVKERRITVEVTDRLQAIYTGPEILNQIDAFRADVANGFARYKGTPGNRVTTVSRLITYSSICVFAQVQRDYSPLTEGQTQSPKSLYVVLVPKHSSDDPRNLNTTGWAMLYDGVQEDGSQPEDVCR